jgi:hypothetical protein
MPRRHAWAIQDLADRLDHMIIFRAVGKQATRLLEEGYAAKGFRIDTKSSDWGPMSGFVCVDPRFSKYAGEKVAANAGHAAEALRGAIRQDAVGGNSGPQPTCPGLAGRLQAHRDLSGPLRRADQTRLDGRP